MAEQPAERIHMDYERYAFEIRMGLALLPKGKRQQTFQTDFNRLLTDDLEGRVLDFDQPAAETAAVLAARRQSKGMNADIRDTQIAGIVKARRAKFATRNVRNFFDFEFELINPWSLQP